MYIKKERILERGKVKLKQSLLIFLLINLTDNSFFKIRMATVYPGILVNI